MSLSLNPANLFPKSIHHESDTAHEVKDYSKGYLNESLNDQVGKFFRNKFYLPFMTFKEARNLQEKVDVSDPDFFEKSSLIYLKTFAGMFEKKVNQIDPTFSHFDEVRNSFSVCDIPIKIHSKTKTVILNVRIVESNNFGQQKGGCRYVLFSLNENLEESNQEVKHWDPKSLDEISIMPIQLMKALEQKMQLDSLMCFSLGALTFEGLNHCNEDVLPNKIIINRGLTSIKKVSSSILAYPLSYIVYQICSLWHLDADAESSLLNYLEKHPKIASQKSVVLIKATKDHYFSGSSDYHPDFFSRIQNIVREAFEGSFLVPHLSPIAHHALRPDWVIGHPETGSQTSQFIPIEASETLADALNNYICEPNKDNTCLIVGGSKDNLDSMLYSLTGVLNSWVRSQQDL